MKKRRRDDESESVSEESEQSVEKAVRAAAKEIQRRLDSGFPDPEALAQDPAFLRASERLARRNVPFELVWRLARASVAILAAIAHRATALRDDVPPEWLEWAYPRLTKVYAGELMGLLDAIERHGEPPFLARVLARADHDWSEGWCGAVVTAFVARRVAAGESPSAAELDEAVDPARREVVDIVVRSLEGTLPAATYRDLRRSETRRFLESIGRVWEGPQGMPALTSVGGRDAAVLAVHEALGQVPPYSLLLVGEHGTGKSAVLRTALTELLDEGWLVFEAGAPEIHAGCQYIGQMESRVREIATHAAGARIVWIFPQFEGALWEGQHARSPRGLLDMLMPFVESGRLVLVGEVEPEAYELLIRQRRRVASLFEVLRLDPLTPDEAIAVARDWRDRVGADIDDATIDEAHELAQHYLASIAAHAGLLRLLKAAVGARDPQLPVRTEHVLATLSEATGLPLHVVDAEMPLDLDEVRTFFATRVLGQREAVDCLVDRIALTKAKLTDPTRPLGVFLFVGPTGTGKTEIAKALAEFLFGSADRLVRLDMTEFQTPESLERLLADAAAADEAAPLISAVRAKPFSVVLLDEFEKAHHNIWNVFLQLFDDGRLTDRQGRTADFRQCVVILTSNVGSAVESARPLGFTGEGGPRFRPSQVERGLARTFTPEFLNRIDQIVVFRPLERDQMRALLERELAQVLERRGFRNRPWAVEWDEAALELLVEKGFSAELGARPLKRAVERYLLAPLARAIVSRSFPEGEQFLFITARGDRIEVAFVDPDAEEEQAAPISPATGLRLERLVFGPDGGREEQAFLQAETERLRAVIEGEAWSGEKERDLELIRGDDFWESPERFDVLARIEYVDRVQAAFRTAENLATRLARLGRNGHGSARGLVTLLAERLYLLDRACAGASPSDPADAFLELRSTGLERAGDRFRQQLQEMYEAWATRRGMRVRELWSETSRLLAVSGIGAYRILSAETGLHVFESPHDERSFDRVAVDVAVAPWPPTAPDVDVLETARRALGGVPSSTTVVRRYRTKPSPLVRDSVRDWRTGRLDRVLAGDFDVLVDE